ncbi:MAG: DUF2391 family protein [Halobacteriaceae archaeon]
MVEGRRGRRYALADSAQQVVGAVLLAGPFVVTEEVWVLAANMTVAHAAVTVGFVVAIGYGALYKADDDRDPDREVELGGVPVRFLSLMAVSYGSVLLLALSLTAPSTFAAVVGGIDTQVEEAIFTAKAVSVGAIFSVVGAATADSVF